MRIVTTNHTWPPGRRVMVTGHRNIYGARAEGVRKVLTEVLRSLQERTLRGVLAVSGMAVGADAEFVDAAICLGIPFVAAVPTATQDARWPQHARERYAEHLRRAAMVVHVWEDPAYAQSSYGAQMHARNAWMLDHVAKDDGVVVAVWDGRNTGGTASAVAGAHARGRKVLVVDPNTLEVRVQPIPVPDPSQANTSAEKSTFSMDDLMRVKREMLRWSIPLTMDVSAPLTWDDTVVPTEVLRDMMKDFGGFAQPYPSRSVIEKGTLIHQDIADALRVSTRLLDVGFKIV